MAEKRLSTDAVAAATAPETAAVFVTLVTINVDGDAVLHVCDDKQAITSQGTEFIPCGFTALLPDQSEGGNKSCRLSIDNADLSIYKIIKQAVNKPITADVAVVLSTSSDTYEQGPLHFVLRNVTATVDAITGELYDAYMHDRKFTSLTYSPDDFPGMFF